MAKRGFRLIDAEMHVMEPTDLWQRYIDPEFRSRAPRRLDEVLTFVKQNPGAFRSVITSDFSQDYTGDANISVLKSTNGGSSWTPLTDAVTSARRLRRPSLRKRYHADGGQASTGSSAR